MGMMMGTRLGTWECVCELVRKHGDICGNSIGNCGTCVGTRLGTREHGSVLLGEQLHVFGNMGTTRMIPCTKSVMDMGTMNGLGNTSIHAACLHNMHHVHCLHTILITFIHDWQCTTLHNTYGDICMTHL